MTSHDAYPHELVGHDAPAPVDPPARIREMAREAARRAAPPIDDEPLFGSSDWRMAASLVVLGDEANHANPDRDKSSDGTIGDARHQSRGTASDHNPWLRYKGVGICRARDIDASGLPMAKAVERARIRAYRGELPALRDGGYIIYAGKITKPDFTGWARYTGDNPHVLMAHFSVSTDPDRFDDREPWLLFTEAPPPAKSRPRPRPSKSVQVDDSAGQEKPSTRWLRRGPDNYPPGDPRHYATRALQTRLRTRFPAYARRLTVDGRYGPATEAVVREYQRRKGIEATGIAGPVTLSALGL